MNGREIILNNTESLVKDVSSRKIDKREFKKKYNNIVNDVEKVLDKSMLTRSQNKIIDILSQLKEFVEGPPYRQPGTTNMFWIRKWRICCTEKKSTRKRLKNFNTKPNA